MAEFRVLPLDTYGVMLYAVEDSGYIERYCNTKEDAQERCDKLNGETTK
jgi:hypothetical protein